MRAPINPNRTAMMRRMRITSPKKRAPKIVKIMGSTKKMAIASAIGSVFKEMKNSQVASARQTPLMICATENELRCGVRRQIYNKGRSNSICIVKRAAETCEAGSPAPSHFAQASNPGRSSIAVTIKMIPDNGLCASACLISLSYHTYAKGLSLFLACQQITKKKTDEF